MTTNTGDAPAPLTTLDPPDAPPAPGTDPVPSPNRVRDLHPGWFASVMGTAILAVATYLNPRNLASLQPAAHWCGAALAVLAYALGAVLTLAYAARWARHRRAALADLRHPVLGAMHATLPGGLLVLAVMTSTVGPELFPAGAVAALIAVLALLGSALAIVFAVAFAMTLFVGDSPPASVNGGWFIPPVVTIIIPMALTPLMPHVGAGSARLLLVLGYAAYGMGFMLFLMVLGLLYDRLVLHPVPPAQLAPSLWIGLGPVAVAVLAPLALARAGHSLLGAAAPAVATLSQLFGTAIWGFGLWWLAIVITMLLRYLRAGTVPFHLGWWAFTFPLGAYTVATMTLARAWQTPALEVTGVLLYLMLVGFWAVVTIRTVAATKTGRIWQR